MQATIGVTQELAAKLGVSEKNTTSEVNLAVRTYLYSAAKLTPPNVGARGDAELDGMMYDILARKYQKSGKLGDIDIAKLAKLAKRLGRKNPVA